MDNLPTNVICPGQRNLMGEGSSVLRAVFSVYWEKGSPSCQVFYLHEHKLELSYDGISALENEVLQTLKQHSSNNDPVGVIYLGYEGITMTPVNQQDVGWAMLNP